MEEVYIIQHGDTSAHKIGISGNPAKRLVSMQTSNPVSLRMVWHGIPKKRNAVDIERKLHQYFSVLCISGEWFDLAAEHIETAIDYVKGKVDLPDRLFLLYQHDTILLDTIPLDAVRQLKVDKFEELAIAAGIDAEQTRVKLEQKEAQYDVLKSDYVDLLSQYNTAIKDVSLLRRECDRLRAYQATDKDWQIDALTFQRDNAKQWAEFKGWLLWLVWGDNQIFQRDINKLEELRKHDRKSILMTGLG